MKNLTKLVLVAIGSLSLAALTPAEAQIIITEVDPAGSGTTYGSDWFELTNTGSSSVDITGWKMDDNSGLFTNAVPMSLSGNNIAAGQSVVFFETASLSTVTTSFVNVWFGGTAPTGFTTGSYSGSGVGLSTAGDAVNIFNSSGSLVAAVHFGAPTGSATFDNAAGLTSTTTANGPLISTASVAGTNGGLTASNGEIGSPAAVPEPSTYALLLGGALMLVVIQFCRGNRIKA